MAPKKKAIELVDKMYMSTEWLKEENYNPLQEYQRIKKCAAIAVDEILYYSKAHGFIALTEYWEEVKNEIQNL